MDFYSVLYLATYLSPLILVAGLIIGGIEFHHLDRVHKILVFYLSFALIIDLLGRYFAKVYGHNLLLIPFFGLTELSCFFMIYRQKVLIGKNLLITIMSGLTVIFILYEVWENRLMNTITFQSYSRVLVSFNIILMCIRYFTLKINENVSGFSSLFSLNTAIFIFYSLNLIVFLPINFLINENTELKFYFWLLNLLVTISFYSFLIRLLWKNGKIQIR